MIGAFICGVIVGLILGVGGSAVWAWLSMGGKDDE